MKEPDKRDERTFKSWLFEEKPLFKKENRYLEEGLDFVALAESRECGALDIGIAKLMDHAIPRNVSCSPLPNLSIVNLQICRGSSRLLERDKRQITKHSFSEAVPG